MQWLQDTNQNNVNNLNNVKLKAILYFRNRKTEYVRTKTEEHETNSKTKNIRDLCRTVNDFK